MYDVAIGNWHLFGATFTLTRKCNDPNCLDTVLVDINYVNKIKFFIIQDLQNDTECDNSYVYCNRKLADVETA
jgi:hypothetical protein